MSRGHFIGKKENTESVGTKNSEVLDLSMNEDRLLRTQIFSGKVLKRYSSLDLQEKLRAF